MMAAVPLSQRLWASSLRQILPGRQYPCLCSAYGSRLPARRALVKQVVCCIKLKGTYHPVIDKHLQRNRISITAAASNSSVVEDAGKTDSIEDNENALSAAQAVLQAFREALPELRDELMEMLLANNAAFFLRPPAQARARLEEISRYLEITLPHAARLVARVPAAWEAPPQALEQRLTPLAQQLGVPRSAAAELLASQPAVWHIANPVLVKDRLGALADRMQVPMPMCVDMVIRQALLWVVRPEHVTAGVRQVASRLGIDVQEASELVARMPVLLVAQPGKMLLNVKELAAATDTPVPRLLELVAHSVCITALPTNLVAAGLMAVARGLAVPPEAAVELAIKQPMLLCLQLASIRNVVDLLSGCLEVEGPQALAVLADQPSLMYDCGPETIAARLQDLTTVFGVPPDQARQLAAAQPALLVMTPGLLRAGLAAIQARTSCSPSSALEVLVHDPATFVGFGAGPTSDEWCSRLDLEHDLVDRLLSEQPALLQVAPGAIRARLESLCALFCVPQVIAAQLVLKHPALAAVLPNATITRGKQISLALGCTMQTAGALLAKEPATLLLAAAVPRAPTGLNGGAGAGTSTTAPARSSTMSPGGLILPGGGSDTTASGGASTAVLHPYLDTISQLSAAYEHYTLNWLQQQARAAAPAATARANSFSDMDG